MSSAPRLLILTTVPVTANRLMRGQLQWLREQGAAVTVISSPGAELDALGAREGVATLGLPMPRNVAPLRDAIALGKLCWLMWRLQPDLVCASTPKAGLLGMLAAKACGVPARIYMLRGLRLETTRGLARLLLGTLEGLAATCATQVVAVSPSLATAARGSGFFPPDKLTVLGSGSSNGVDTERYSPTPELQARARELRKAHGISPEEPVIGFVGRPVRDKGIYELIEAYERLVTRHPNVHLMVAGFDLGGDAAPPELLAWIDRQPRVHALGDVREMPVLYAALDLLAFPSYREGFPNVPLEAACMGVPVVGARATGTVDAVLDQQTGTLVPRGDAAGLAEALASYLEQPALRQRHGEAARVRAVECFAQPRVCSAWRALYEQALAEAGRPRFTGRPLPPVAAGQACADASELRSSGTASSSTDASRVATTSASGTKTGHPSAWKTTAAPSLPPFPRRRGLAGLYNRALKRGFDLCAAVVLLVLTAPVMLVVALLVRLQLGRPILFRQTRPGLHGRPFTLFKFRTMRNAYAPDGTPLSDEQRLTRLGRLLRATSLDELPELVNVVRGEMSLVGPRPLLMEYLPRYSAEQFRRHEARPGITGLAQVSGRNELDWPTRFRLDVAYVERQSLWLDLWILARTVTAVLRRRGISAEGHATMPHFEGNAAFDSPAPRGLDGQK